MAGATAIGLVWINAHSGALAAPDARQDPIRVGANGPDPREPGGGGVVVLGTTAADSVAVRSDQQTGEYLVSDPAGVTVYAPCSNDSPTEARCPRLGPKIFAELFRGRNRLWVHAGVNAKSVTYYGGNDAETVRVDDTARAFVLSSLGSDTVFGGPGDDVLNDSGGQDRLHGGGGHDFIRAGPGHDVLLGGAGPDRIHADNHDHDRLISCGGNSGDKAIIDQQLDPTPVGCPVIRTGHVPSK